MKQRRTRKFQMLGVRVKRSGTLYLLLLPAVILAFIFAYLPMYGIVIAFKQFNPIAGITQSPWAQPWNRYFQQFFRSYQFSRLIRNTLIINIYSLLVTFPFPIILALLLNQVQKSKFKKIVQTVSYMPHFISTVVLVGMINIFLSPSSGLIGTIYGLFGLTAPNIMGMPGAFPSVYVWSDVWQHTGWDSIIYLAALSAVDVSLYEAAEVDGATRWQKLRYIDLPMILPTISILLILRVGNLMNIGFEKVYLMQNNMNLITSEVISTYVYKTGILNNQYSYSTAINMFNNVINFILLVSVNQVTKRVSDSSLW